jgi:thiol-disulfide isomerase/thioredoxin
MIILMLILNSMVDQTTETKTKPKHIIVRFGATWCSPCKEMQADVWDKPEIKRLLEDNFQVFYIDVDKYPKHVQGYKVRTIPAFVIGHFNKDSKVKIDQRHQGYKSLQFVTQVLKDFVRKNQEKKLDYIGL